MQNAPLSHPDAAAEATELLAAISASETVIITTIERECEALRARRLLAAQALHTRLCDAVKIYLHATKAARASLHTLEQILPGSRDFLEEGRRSFAALLKLELAVLATERAAVGVGAPSTSFTGESLFGSNIAQQPMPAPLPRMPAAVTPVGWAAAPLDDEIAKPPFRVTA